MLAPALYIESEYGVQRIHRISLQILQDSIAMSGSTVDPSEHHGVRGCLDMQKV